jgi:hypothetical protein
MDASEIYVRPLVMEWAGCGSFRAKAPQLDEHSIHYAKFRLVLTTVCISRWMSDEVSDELMTEAPRRLTRMSASRWSFPRGTLGAGNVVDL